jgi:hypothetical protein
MGSRSVEGEESSLADDYDALISTTDVELLKRAWRNEKAAPEILRFESDLITRVRGQIELMVTLQTLVTFYFFDISSYSACQLK